MPEARKLKNIPSFLKINHNHHNNTFKKGIQNKISGGKNNSKQILTIPPFLRQKSLAVELKRPHIVASPSKDIKIGRNKSDGNIFSGFVPMNIIKKVPVSLPELFYIIQECMSLIKFSIFSDQVFEYGCIDSKGKIFVYPQYNSEIRHFSDKQELKKQKEVEEVKSLLKKVKGFVKPIFDDFCKYLEFCLIENKRNENDCTIKFVNQAICSYLSICNRKSQDRISYHTLKSMFTYQTRRYRSSKMINLSLNKIGNQKSPEQARDIFYKIKEVLQEQPHLKLKENHPSNKDSRNPSSRRNTAKSPNIFTQFKKITPSKEAQSALFRTLHKNENKRPECFGGSCPIWFLRSKNKYIQWDNEEDEEKTQMVEKAISPSVRSQQYIHRLIGQNINIKGWEQVKKKYERGKKAARSEAIQQISEQGVGIRESFYLKKQNWPRKHEEGDNRWKIPYWKNQRAGPFSSFCRQKSRQQHQLTQK